MASKKAQIRYIKRTDIRPDPEQPRKNAAEEVEEMRENIKRLGILQPLRVRYEPSRYDGTPFVITAGERRWWASEGILDELPCIEANEEDAGEVALAENIHRVQLTPNEEAEALQKLAARENLSQNQLARRIGKSEGYVTNRLGLLKAGEDVQALAAAAPAKMSHALLIERVKEPELRRELIEDAATGASYKAIEGKIEEAKAKEDLKTASQKAPDRETAERSTAFFSGGTPNMSRGERVKGAKRRERHEVRADVLRKQTELIVLSGQLNDADFDELIITFCRRFLRGDLARK